MKKILSFFLTYFCFIVPVKAEIIKFPPEIISAFTSNRSRAYSGVEGYCFFAEKPFKITSYVAQIKMASSNKIFTDFYDKNQNKTTVSGDTDGFILSGCHGINMKPNAPIPKELIEPAYTPVPKNGTGNIKCRIGDTELNFNGENLNEDINFSGSLLAKIKSENGRTFYISKNSCSF